MPVIQKPVSDGEFRALFETDAPVIATYQVGFALVSVISNVEDAQLGGSGTLVAIDDQLGILTAEHVVSSLFAHKGGQVGLILAKHDESQRHRLFFEPKPNECTVFTRFPYTPQGPDLAFIPLDHKTIGALKSKKDFYSLTKRRDRMLDRPPATDMGAWIISGMAAEWTKDADVHAPFVRTKIFKGMIGEVHAGEIETRSGLDYQSFSAMVGGPSGWPESYEGYSGAGIWQILVTQVNGKLEVAERLLSGVAFLKSDPLQEDGVTVRHLSCHSRQSIYGALVDAVRNTLRGL